LIDKKTLEEYKELAKGLGITVERLINHVLVQALQNYKRRSRRVPR